MARLRSIRFRLLVAVNVAMAFLLLVFLVVDYFREIADRVAETHIALEGEAKTLLSAVVRLRPQGTPVIQEHVDTVCGQMQDSTSPGHHIGVRLGGVVLQAKTHHRASPDIFAAMQAAGQSATHRATVGSEELVVGNSTSGNASVYVSEYLTNIQRSARGQVFLRLAGILLLVVVATAVINLVFLRMAAKPLENLVETVRQIARGQLGVQTGPFKAAELDYLAQEINSMSSSLDEVERRRRQEMAKARRIQDRLLPQQMEVPGLSISHLYQPATEVAGDYYDILPLPDRTWLFCIADVAGHGIPAAMNATMLKTLLLQASEAHVAPDQILRFVNERFIAVSLDEVFASMLIVRWCPDTSTLEYASAGHEIAWLYSARSGALRELTATGLPLGVCPTSTCQSQTVALVPEDRLLLVTDGVTETFNGRSEPFGRDRLANLFLQCSTTPLGETVRKIDETLNAYRGDGVLTDDTTLIAIQFSG
jgi:sigma-B regulation protein RsbU (phosphoserine phosphatase)